MSVIELKKPATPATSPLVDTFDTPPVPQEWLELSPLAHITASMRKADLDRFHYGLMQLAQGMAHLQSAVSHLARNDTARALEMSGMSAGELTSALRLFSSWYVGITTHSVQTKRKRASRKREVQPPQK